MLEDQLKTLKYRSESKLHTLRKKIKSHMPFVLEVVRFIQDRDEWMAKGGKQEHVGYMRSHFRTKSAAASYYDRHNPHMRGLNTHNTWASDWDPTTSLMYIVRHDHHLIQTIAPFDPADEPIIERTESGVGTTANWLR